MREVLFRGKRVDNCEWVYGYLVSIEASNIKTTDKKTNQRVYCITKPSIPFEITVNDADSFDFALYRVAPETVEQYTGLTDKNGKKIFEGDILKQKTTPEFAKVNSFKWEHYGIVRFGEYDWNECSAGHSSVGWYIEPLKSVSIKPKNYLVGNIQAGLNQFDLHNKYYPMEVIGNIHDNLELLERSDNNDR